MKIYPDKILNMIIQKGYTINAFATKFEFTQQSLSAWLKGEYNPKPASVRRLAKALDCEITDIAEYSGNLEKVFDEIDADREKYNSMFFGADIYDNVKDIENQLEVKKELSPSSPEYKECNQRITGNLMSMWQKATKKLNVEDAPVSYIVAIEEALFKYQTQIKDAVMVSDKIDADVKIKVYNIIKDLSWKSNI